MARKPDASNVPNDDDLIVTEVYFERVFNLGNYQTFRIGLHATVGPGQTREEVLGKLDRAVLKARKEHLSEI